MRITLEIFKFYPTLINIKIAFFALFLTLFQFFSCNQKSVEKSSQMVQTDRLDWFKEAKFGMFIHWGPYSKLAGEWNGRQLPQGENAEWIMQKFQIPVEEYRKVASTFNPTKFNAEEWVALAKHSGMKYLVITSKHHDGFAMYHSKVSNYNIIDYTPFTRDIYDELSKACHEAGIRFCFYYSHREDWDHPYAYGNFWDYDSSQTNDDSMDYPELFRKYLDEKAKPQIHELLSNYGPIGLVWFDRGMYTQEQGKEFVDLIHSIQPECIVNGRVGHYDKELLGDYQNMSDNGMPIGGIEEYWESPQTLNDTWGYSKYDHNWKSAEEIIRNMLIIVSKGGNYLLNIGPTGEGIIPQPSVDVLTKVGNWMQKNSESIYGTSPSPFSQELSWGYCTLKGNKIYLHVFMWPENCQLELAGLNNQVNNVYLLVNKNKTLPVQRNEENRLLISLPENPVDEINSVVVLEISGKPEIDPMIIEQEKNKPISLDYLTATTTGNTVKRYNRKGEFHISKMQGPEDIIKWQININTTGMYDLFITYATSPEWENSKYIVKTDLEQIISIIKPSDEWYEYRTEKIGRFNFTETGSTIVQIHPATQLQNPLMYFRSMELVPVAE